jgi:hypothetical protein
MKFIAMIPMNHSNGHPVHPIEFEGIVRLLWNKFGGCTVDAVADGYWKDSSGKLYTDKVRRVTVVVDSNSKANLDYARLLVRRIGVRLYQESMYFEHDAEGYTIVEFLEIDQDEDFTALGAELSR